MVKDLNESTGNYTGRVRGVTVSTTRADGWNNVMIGLGKKQADKTVYTEIAPFKMFTDNELSNIFMADGLSKRIITMKPQDATRQWITLQNDVDNKVQNELKRLNVQSKLTKALTYARLYRGSIMVLIEEGTVDLTKPLNKKTKALSQIRVYSAARIELSSTDIVDDPGSKYFDEVEFFTVRKRNGISMKVHASRCLVFKGEEVPDYGEIDFKLLYWGLPVLTDMYDKIKNWGATMQAIANLLLEFNLGKYTLSNLSQMLSGNQKDAVDKIYERMGIINVSKSMLNAVLLGEGEGYERDSASLGGLADTLDRIMIDIAAISGYPVSKLWGRSAAGLNATGEGDKDNYYDEVKSYQENIIYNPLNKIITYISQYLSVDNISFTFSPLEQMSEKEQSEINNKNANTHNMDITNGVITPEESRSMRYSFLDEEQTGTIQLEGNE